MPSQELTLHDYRAALRRRRGLLLRVILLVAVPAVAIALLLPAVYRSEAIILIEQQEIPADLVRSTVTSFADQRIQTISQRVMTSTNLMSIIEKYDLYIEERAREPREVVLQEMRQNIGRRMISADVVDPRSGRPTEATIAFSLSFDSRSPQTAQRVANELVSLYLNENIKSRTEAAAETASFLTDEARGLRERVEELEGRLADFKERNADNQPDLERMTREMLNRTDSELSEIDRRQEVARRDRIFVEAQLTQTEPFDSSGTPGELSSIERLRATEAELAGAEASYGVNHPDVVRLRKMADALRSQVKPGEARQIYEDEMEQARLELARVEREYGADHPDVGTARRKVDTLTAKLAGLPQEDASATPTNPVYLSLQARLEGIDAEIAGLQRQREQLAARRAEQQANLARIPAVEAEYREIVREYDTTMQKYREITAKQMEARLSENLEAERKGEKFTLIEPPMTPEQPAKPNRGAILAAGLVLAMFCALGAVFLAESLDNRVRGRRGIQQLLTAPPLACIPVIDPDAASARPGRGWLAVLGGAAGVGVLTLTVAHFVYRPLDVLWFVVLRKLGF
ncbi:MAG: Wzz/FepE/Etk N-terminal domain-containing protein [Gammaproteobacteria bacterium]